jgi:hypothetical protein
MHSQRTSMPSSSARPLDRPPNPGDAIAEFVEDLRAGDDRDLYTDDDAIEADESAHALESLRNAASTSARQVPVPSLPPVLQRIFGTDAEDELMAVANLLDPKARKTLTLVFHTPIGDVRTAVNWSSHPPEALSRAKDLLLILVRTASSTFSPNPGSDLEISFAEHRDRRLKVTCLAPPMKLYPGVGVDLLCFLPHTALVEKNGQLREGAPSVVSGNPSTHVDDDGEPVADGEKSAAWKSPSRQAAVDADVVVDFDVPRAG